MKRIFALLASIVALSTLTSCEYFYSLDLENQFEKGIYIWSQEQDSKQETTRPHWMSLTANGTSTTSNLAIWAHSQI